MRRLIHITAAIPVLVGLALLAPFLDGSLAARLAAPVYLVLLSASILVGSLAARQTHPAVPAAGALGLVSSGAWLWVRAPASLPPMETIASSWRLGLPAGGGVPTWWPLVLALPAGLIVLLETVRGEPELPVDEGARGWLEGLPGRADLFGLSMLGVGVAGTLFAGSTFLEKVAVVAPIFEEYAKLGVALLVLTALGLSRSGPAFSLGILSGLAFGLMEHAVTYPAESTSMFVVRGFFHALAAGLSALVYVHLRRREGLAPGAAWFAIAPSALVHAANNVAAVVIAIAEAMGTAGTVWISGMLSIAFVAMLAVLAIVTGLRPGRSCDVIESFWHRFNGEIDRRGFVAREA